MFCFSSFCCCYCCCCIFCSFSFRIFRIANKTQYTHIYIYIYDESAIDATQQAAYKRFKKQNSIRIFCVFIYLSDRPVLCVGLMCVVICFFFIRVANRGFLKFFFFVLYCFTDDSLYKVLCSYRIQRQLNFE